MRLRLIGSLLIFLAAQTYPTAAIQNALLQVHFIDVGQGDSILIQAPDGETTLFDGGDRNGEVREKLNLRKTLIPK